MPFSNHWLFLLSFVFVLFVSICCFKLKWSGQSKWPLESLQLCVIMHIVHIVHMLSQASISLSCVFFSKEVSIRSMLKISSLPSHRCLLIPSIIPVLIFLSILYVLHKQNHVWTFFTFHTIFNIYFVTYQCWIACLRTTSQCNALIHLVCWLICLLIFES